MESNCNEKLIINPKAELEADIMKGNEVLAHKKCSLGCEISLKEIAIISGAAVFLLHTVICTARMINSNKEKGFTDKMMKKCGNCKKIISKKAKKLLPF